MVLFLAVRPAHAVFGAVGWLGYGRVFVGAGDDEWLGPTLELGASFSVPFIALDLTYWNDLDEAGDSSQIRLGARLKPPIIPLYGRLAFGIPFDSDVRDVAGYDIVFGVGYTALSLPLIKLNIELDYHYFTEGIDVNPVELKAGVAIGF